MAQTAPIIAFCDTEAPTVGAVSFQNHNPATPQGAIQHIRPLEDARWPAFLESHPLASVFHTRAWLDALRRTYGYEPVAFTNTQPGQTLRGAWLFCRIESILTGKRLVSLPFADHCEPLMEQNGNLDRYCENLKRYCEENSLSYIEIRPAGSERDMPAMFNTPYPFCFHRLDLTEDLATIFNNFHQSSTQRKIRRGEREHLRYEEGRSEVLLDVFYKMFLKTRRRQHLFPQPKQWFRNLIHSFGSGLKIRVAFKDLTPVAAILTLRYKDTLVYKYGCSDARFNNLGGTHLLMWRSIEEAKHDGLRVFDLGRTDCANTGLIIFKDRWGAARLPLFYWRYSAAKKWDRKITMADGSLAMRLVKPFVSHMPDWALVSAGNLLYRHMG